MEGYLCICDEPLNVREIGCEFLVAAYGNLEAGGEDGVHAVG